MCTENHQYWQFTDFKEGKQQKLPKFQIAVTMVTVTTMWFDLAFQLAP